MFLRRLSSFGSSFPPSRHLAVSQAGFRSSSASSSSSSSSSVFLPQFLPAPPPWWPVQGFPPWPPRLARRHPSAHQVVTGRPSHPLNPGSFGGGQRPFSTSAGRMMERHDRDREPPFKRRKSTEERGGRPRELESRKDGGLRPNHQLRDGSGGEGRNGAVMAASRGRIWDKDTERTKSGSKGSPSRSGSPHSQPAGSGTQTPRAEQDSGHKPNPWFKDRGPEEQGGSHRNSRGPAGQPQDRSLGGGQRSEPHSNAQHTNLWQVAGANRQPPPPGTSASHPLQRHWESLSSDPQPPGGSSTAFDFSVMSYNILSQELLQDNAYLYRHCNSAFLPWEYRLPNLLTEIQQHDADILCLQEVQQDHYENQIKPALQALGYHCEYKKRTGRKPDGCAVSFKTSRFSLLSSNPVEFFRPGDALLDRDNVGLVVLLRPNGDRSDPSSFICVGNTHLLYNPRRGDVKLAQLAILLAEISRLSRLPDGPTNPVLLCGDFNSTPWSPLYSFLTSGGLDYRGMQIGMVSGQENSPRGQRLLTSPIWSHSLGINHQCQYDQPAAAEAPPTSPTAVEGAISHLTVQDLSSKAAVSLHRSRLEHGVKLQSSYCHQLMPDGRPEVTTCHSRTAMTVDYILYSPDFLMPSIPGGRGLQLLSRLSLVGQPELEEVNGLPNQHHSSDHLPLLARFRFRL